MCVCSWFVVCWSFVGGCWLLIVVCVFCLAFGVVCPVFCLVLGVLVFVVCGSLPLAVF